MGKYIMLSINCVDYFSNNLSENFEKDYFPCNLIFYLEKGLARE